MPHVSWGLPGRVASYQFDRKEREMSYRKEMVARILLDIQAVHFNDSRPFVFTSGTVSPVYVDCRKLISFPDHRRRVLEIAREIVEKELAEQSIDVIAGGETAGIPYAAWLAFYLDLPLIYVRKEPKGFGGLKQIEGVLPERAVVLLVEDLLFDAQSKINFCEAIRREGGGVNHTLVVFDYGNPEAPAKLKEHGIQVHALTDWEMLLAVAEKDGYFSEAQSKLIRSFLDNPSRWSGEHQRSSSR